MKFRLLILVLILSIGVFSQTKAQLYAGASYVYAQLSDSGLDQVYGFSFDLQGDFPTGNERTTLSPTFRMAVLESKIYNQGNPFYAKNFSFSPLLAYRLVSLKGLTISFYGGPFISQLEGRKTPSLLNTFEYISDTRFGAEFGLEFKLDFFGFFDLKMNPINLLIGNEEYRQGHINLMVNF
ncbi:MAG TPA: hypothetical protein V6C96_03590 [Vampirovibrionales bacterium]